MEREGKGREEYSTSIFWEEMTFFWHVGCLTDDALCVRLRVYPVSVCIYAFTRKADCEGAEGMGVVGSGSGSASVLSQKTQGFFYFILL